jgi:hypothetical protein
MNDYDDNPAIKQMQEYHDTPDVWAVYKDQFSRRPPSDRIAQLQQLDLWLQTQDRPTRQTAEFIQMKRDLSDIHWLMRRADR